MEGSKNVPPRPHNFMRTEFLTVSGGSLRPHMKFGPESTYNEV
jgi:hypothetical protein